MSSHALEAASKSSHLLSVVPSMSITFTKYIYTSRDSRDCFSNILSIFQRGLGLGMMICITTLTSNLVRLKIDFLTVKRIWHNSGSLDYVFKIF